MREVWVATILGSSLIMTLVVIQAIREGGGSPIGFFIATVLVVAVTFLSAYFVSRGLNRFEK